MTKTTTKGLVTSPKKLHEEVGFKPGDKIEVRGTCGGIYIEKPGNSQRYRERLEALARERSIQTCGMDNMEADDSFT